MRFIAKELGKRVGRCVAEVAQHCRSDWKHAHAFVQCAVSIMIFYLFTDYASTTPITFDFYNL